MWLCADISYVHMMASRQKCVKKKKKVWQSGSAAAYPLASLKARPSSWETSSMTSLGRTGNTKIAGQPGSQPRACTPDRTKVHNVFSMCLICPLTTVFSLSLSLSLHLPSSSSVLLALSSSPSTDNPLLLSRHFSLFLPDSVVVEARSHALLLAGCSVRSLYRCRGLFAAFGEQRRGREGRGGGRREGWMATMDGWMDG